MTGYPTNPSDAHAPQKPQKGWFGRNWFWFLPLVILGPIVCCCGGFFGFGYFAVSKGIEELQKMPPYAETLSLVETDPRANAAIGTPVEVKGLFEAASEGHQFNVTEVSMDAQIPVSGPNGSGVLHIDASLDASGNWTYLQRELRVDSTGEVIDFLAPATPSDTPDAP